MKATFTPGHSRTSSNVSDGKGNKGSLERKSKTTSGSPKRQTSCPGSGTGSGAGDKMVQCTIKEPGVRLLLSIGRKGKGEGCLSRKW